MPLPLAMMIPFMGIQSAVMAKQFGENFQYGKRRISAMSNDEFNKLTPQKIQEQANLELKAMIPSMQQSIVDMNEFQKFVIQQFVKVMEDLIHAFPQALLDILGIDIKLHDDVDVTPPITDTTPPITETTDLIHLTQGEVLSMSDTQLAQAHDNNFARYDSATQQLIKVDYERRGLSTLGEHKHTLDHHEVPSDIPLVNFVGLKIHAIGRMVSLNYTGPNDSQPWTFQTNPQRNGNWRTKFKVIGKQNAINRGHKEWPSTDHSLHITRQGTTQYYFWLRKVDKTIINFPN